MVVAAKINLYITWKTIDLNIKFANAIRHLRCLLGKAIAHCMGKELNKALLENCGKCPAGRPLGLFGVWSPSSHKVDTYGPLGLF